MQRRKLLTVGLALAALLTVGQTAPSSAALDPFKTLGKTLGLSKDQAAGGLGSILTLAQEKLAKGDFDKVAAAIPGASKYLDQAKKLGAVTGPLKNLAGLNSALGKLGIDAQTASKFVPAVTDMVSKVGGSDVGKLLSGALST
jgi:hypothetical protein